MQSRDGLAFPWPPDPLADRDDPDLGRPYFVGEFVEGYKTPTTGHRLPTRTADRPARHRGAAADPRR